MTLIDTADVYCLGEEDIGHNERLVRRALEVWRGPRPIVATKGGMARPKGAWTRDGSPAKLKEACERSLIALGVSAIDLYQLHTPDPKERFESQVEALAELKQAGKVKHVGLSNVSVDELERARKIVPIVSVQNRTNVFDKRGFTEGMIAHCEAHQIAFMAYCPVGGGGWERTAIGSHAVLNEIGARMNATPYQIALAWLLAKSPITIPIPGASKIASAKSSAAAMALKLTPDDVVSIG